MSISGSVYGVNPRRWGPAIWPRDYFCEPRNTCAPEFVERVMLYWRAGIDTMGIALAIEQPEHLVCQALRMGREAN